MLKQGKEKPNFTPKDPIDIPRRRPAFEQEEPSGLPWGWIALGVIVLGVIAFLLFPAMKGYRAYSAMQDYGVPGEYVSDIKGLADANAACADALNATQQEREECRTHSALCAQDLNAQKALVESLGEDLGQRGADLKACEMEGAQKDAVISDAARRICCIQRVENPAVNGFAVLDGKIACVTEGGEPISC